MKRKPMFGGRHRSFQALAATISIGLLFYLVSKADWVAVGLAWRAIAIGPLALSLMALTASVLIAAKRLQVLARRAGHDVSFASTLSAVGLGQLAGIFFFQIFGQLLMRSALLRGSGVPAATSVFLTLYERLMAMFLLVVLSLAGAITIFGAFGIDIERGGNDFVRLVIGGVFVLATAALWSWGAYFRRVWKLIEPGFFFRITRDVMLTIGIQLCTLAAFVVLATAMAPDIALHRIAAASTIVMFASALPISMAGWGVRELSAVFALGAVGFPASEAVLIGGLIGVLSIGANVIVGFGAFLFASRKISANGIAPVRNDRPMLMLSVGIPLLCVMAVLFQVHVPIGGRAINLNLADPFALLGGGLFLLSCLRSLPRWRLPNLNIYIGLMTLGLGLGFLHGLYTVGWTQWAAINKMVGWFVLLGYGMTGALLVRTLNGAGSKVFGRTLVVSVAAVVVLEFIFDTLRRVGVDPFNMSVRSMGFAGDPNSFAFQIIVATAVLLGVCDRWRLGRLLLAVMTVGLGLTGSRSGFIAFAIVLAVFAVTSWSHAKAALPYVIAGVAVLIFTQVAVDVYLSAHLVSAATTDSVMVNVFREARPHSTVDHIATVKAGIDLFLASPLVGNGLGYFMATYWAAGDYPHPIDSTAVWLLAEFGVVGLIVFLTPFTLLFVREVNHARNGNATASTLVFLLSAFASMSMFYDIMYQRVFWLSLGTFVAWTGVRVGQAPSLQVSPVGYRVSSLLSHAWPAALGYKGRIAHRVSVDGSKELV